MEDANHIGTQTASLTFRETAFADAGRYLVELSDDFSTISTEAQFVVTLEVMDPSILNQPDARRVNPGVGLNLPLNPAFEVTATSAHPPITYTWYHDDGVNPPEVVGTPNSPDPYMLLSNIQEEDEGNYYVVVSNSDTPAGSTASESAFLEVNDPPVIITQPQDILTDLGTGIQLSVTAQCDFSMVFQWSFQPLDESLPMEPILDSDGGRKSGYQVATSPGEQTVFFEVFPTILADEGYYEVTITSPGIGGCTSNRARLLLNE